MKTPGMIRIAFIAVVSAAVGLAGASEPSVEKAPHEGPIPVPPALEQVDDSYIAPDITPSTAKAGEPSIVEHQGFYAIQVNVDAEGQNIVDDAANELLAAEALSHAQAGAHAVAPSAMMDGQIATLRSALDVANLTDTILMSYSSK